MSTFYQLKANTSRSCFVSYGMICNWLWIFTNYGLEKTICSSTFYQLRGMWCIVPQPCLWPSDSEVDVDKCDKSILREFESLLPSWNQSFNFQTFLIDAGTLGAAQVPHRVVWDARWYIWVAWFFPLESKLLREGSLSALDTLYFPNLVSGPFILCITQILTIVLQSGRWYVISCCLSFCPSVDIFLIYGLVSIFCPNAFILSSRVKVKCGKTSLDCSK
jgi:hypothetical protein